MASHLENRRFDQPRTIALRAGLLALTCAWAGCGMCAPAQEVAPSEAAHTPPNGAQSVPHKALTQGWGAEHTGRENLKVGEATERLLDWQRRGSYASSHTYSMPHAVAAKVYERYVNSFSHPIPERLDSIMQDVKP
jgi:hypothetical protein